MFFINIDAKILNKNLVNLIQWYSKSIIPHEQKELIPGMQNWFKHLKSINLIHDINRLKKKII